MSVNIKAAESTVIMAKKELYEVVKLEYPAGSMVITNGVRGQDEYLVKGHDEEILIIQKADQKPIRRHYSKVHAKPL